MPSLYTTSICICRNSIIQNFLHVYLFMYIYLSLCMSFLSIYFYVCLLYLSFYPYLHLSILNMPFSCLYVSLNVCLYIFVYAIFNFAIYFGIFLRMSAYLTFFVSFDNFCFGNSMWRFPCPIGVYSTSLSVSMSVWLWIFLSKTWIYILF